MIGHGRRPGNGGPVSRADGPRSTPLEARTASPTAEPDSVGVPTELLARIWSAVPLSIITELPLDGRGTSVQDRPEMLATPATNSSGRSMSSRKTISPP